MEAEVKQLETTKRNWMTEVEITTKEMERLIQDQQRQQMEVIRLLVVGVTDWLCLGYANLQ